MKLEDLKCEDCDGLGEKERNVDGMDAPCTCGSCNGTGIDDLQLEALFIKKRANVSCFNCGCSIESHASDKTCPDFCGGTFNGWLDTKLVIV